MGGGANSQQAHDIVLTSMRRKDVASTSFRRHVPTRFLIHHCQIITFLIFKSYIRIELKRIVLPVPSNQIKLHLLLFYPSTWYICDFFLFHIEIVGKCGWIIGWGGGTTYPLPPPPSNYMGGLAPLFLRLCHPSVSKHPRTCHKQPACTTKYYETIKF